MSWEDTASAFYNILKTKLDLAVLHTDNYRYKFLLEFTKQLNLLKEGSFLINKTNKQLAGILSGLAVFDIDGLNVDTLESSLECALCDFETHHGQSIQHAFQSSENYEIVNYLEKTQQIVDEILSSEFAIILSESASFADSSETQSQGSSTSNSQSSVAIGGDSDSTYASLSSSSGSRPSSVSSTNSSIGNGIGY